MSEHRVGIAELAAASSGTLASLGLGSCVAIALYDVEAQVGGLAHILLPEGGMSRDHQNPARVPDTAVPELLARMTALGANPTRMTARIAGGASMFANLMPRGSTSIGTRNIEAVRRALAAAGIAVTGEDVGQEHGRSVYLRVADGQFEVRSLVRGTRVL